MLDQLCPIHTIFSVGHKIVSQYTFLKSKKLKHPCEEGGDERMSWRGSLPLLAPLALAASPAWGIYVVGRHRVWETIRQMWQLCKLSFNWTNFNLQLSSAGKYYDQEKANREDPCEPPLHRQTFFFGSHALPGFRAPDCPTVYSIERHTFERFRVTARALAAEKTLFNARAPRVILQKWMQGEQ